ncbi:hypothetical protein A3L04_07180 [Thermococcus chitonophagus]|uniref:Uncharacterized protein n=1 Tax=Thermococcus chitonophagus TaxID=54262 RepID=A0A160VWL1_9EURY|nr:hypothetical protein [Thermococcus chitonophagus]ASJ16870.1 hypothetical protein A3L04_07180 [Thermococcus chitonophagus]CUX78351.1 hypothetical protein CHITON_1572 [Thermococcus chitonophagus]
MGYTIYYRVEITRWSEFVKFIKRICRGLGIGFELSGSYVVVTGEEAESLVIPPSGEGFVKTYGREPITSIYLLILYSISAFGSVLVWED